MSKAKYGYKHIKKVQKKRPGRHSKKLNKHKKKKEKYKKLWYKLIKQFAQQSKNKEL